MPSEADRRRLIEYLFAQLYRRRVLYDVAVEYRWANDVGSSTEVAPDRSADVRALTLRAGATVQF